MKKSTITGVLLIVFTVLSVQGSVAASIPMVGDPSPQFELETLAGRQVSLEDLKCKESVFLVFWATWCRKCTDKVDEINRLYEMFSGKGMTFLAVDVGVNDSRSKVEKFVAENNLAYPVVYDKNRSLTRKFGVFGTPTVIIIDKEGIIRYKNTALPDDLETHFADLMCCC